MPGASIEILFERLLPVEYREAVLLLRPPDLGCRVVLYDVPAQKIPAETAQCGDMLAYCPRRQAFVVKGGHVSGYHARVQPGDHGPVIRLKPVPVSGQKFRE